MLAYVKANYKTGDTIEVTSTQGVFTGEIEYVADQYIILRQPNGQICGISASDIHTFRAECPVPLYPQVIPATQEPVKEESAEAEAAVAEASQMETAQPRQEEEPALQPATVTEPKVVGHIDLDRLRQIDPKFSRRNYFRSSEENNEASGNGTTASENENAFSHGLNYQREPYVGAKGRITYYNSEKRYGFIHDYNTDNDLYFHYQQIADYELYDHLHKGTKVTYTIDRNAQGLTARFVHLPHTVSDLLTKAEDYFDARHYQLAQGLAEHILEADPENKEAKELLDEMRDMAPAPRFAPTATQPSATQYNPCAIYSAAKKAYLAKDYAQAEELYKKAIDAGEKPESCVKDLVTLYVSRFKQAADNAEKEEARTKAITFLNSHRQLLPDNLTTKQFLALNYYLPILDYTNFISTVDEILEDPQVSRVLSRRVFYIWQKGIALNKMGRSEEALHLADEGLALAPRSRQLLNLRNMILYPEMEEPRPVTFSTEELDASIASKKEKAAEVPSASSETETTEEVVEEGDHTAAEETPAEVAEPSAETATEAPAAEEAEESDDTTGEKKDDEWWDDLKKPME